MSQSADLYTKLPSYTPSTRLLRVQPAIDPSDGIECELLVYDIRHAPSYRALSYAWKEHRGVVQVDRDVAQQREGRLEIIDGPLSRISLTVSPSLTLAIRRLRSRHTPQFFWIDAVCINQQDDEERSMQVALMGTIYEGASEVVIWLGERETQDELGEWLQGAYSRTVVNLDFSSVEVARSLVNQYIAGFKMLRDEYNGPVVQKTDVYGAFCLVWLLAQGYNPSDIVFYHNSMFKNRFRMEWAAQVSEGLKAIMARDWWRRAWVVQETVLARRATVVYGTLSAPWLMFADAAMKVSQQKFGQDAEQFSVLGLIPSLVFQVRVGTADALDDFSALVLAIEYTRVERDHKAAVQLLSLLRRFRTRMATDDRDKIFAFHGLATVQTSRPLAINYTMSKRELYIATASHIIEQTRSLSVLRGTLGHTSSPESPPSTNTLDRASKTAYGTTLRRSELPSWVTDWSKLPTDGSLEIDRLDRLEHYSAGDAYSAVHIYSSGILETRGYVVAKVISVAAEIPQPTLERLRQAIRSWCTWWSNHTQQDEAFDDNSVFYTAMCGHLLHNPHGSSNSVVEHSNYRRSDASAILQACKVWLTDTTTQRNRKTAMIGDLVANSYQEPVAVTRLKNSYFYSVRAATSSRRLFTFRRNNASLNELPPKTDIGVGPLNIQAGDIIYIPDGSKVPLIIRRAPTEPGHTFMPGAQSYGISTPERGGINVGSEAQLYRLIGDAYVHGFMDGEALWRSSKVSVLFC
ncbi:heterokaryon incompatibility protein-domain-containing protein [Boeremia exigua]|uniref:heterokaryon incompatibility protein-domain-containing protein n=1 Tax=Boeremia exigua TaxID=749465 RepID=UPI001E8C9E87|nr:heterokaryon incompatibility protein-domain-containing protein [Boeremia exigua]KAH6629590.1 heterokaryon incompatibility protein-domain-containing protein [Boeremia exigua]